MSTDNLLCMCAPLKRRNILALFNLLFWKASKHPLTLRVSAIAVDDYIQASGIHLVRAYKENIERARRTPGLSGIQLLDVRDFPGQGHATTGILDMFWDSKGLIDPESFAHFNSAVVLLMRTSSPTFYNGDSIQVEIDISNFSGEGISGNLEWRLHEGSQQYHGEVAVASAPNSSVTTIAHLNIPVEASNQAHQWTLSVCLNESENHWGFVELPASAKVTARKEYTKSRSSFASPAAKRRLS